MKCKVCITKLARKDFGFELTHSEAEAPTRIRVEMPLPLAVCGLLLAVSPASFSRWLLPATKLFIDDQQIDLLALVGAIPLLKSLLGILRDGKKSLGPNPLKNGAKGVFKKVVDAGSVLGGLLKKVRRKK